jgi:excisionase family DNA binding protein
VLWTKASNNHVGQIRALRERLDLESKTNQRKYKGGSSAKPKRPFAERKGRLMTPEEASDELGVTERMIMRLIYNGELRATHVSKLVRIHVEDLDAYVARQRGESAA